MIKITRGANFRHSIFIYKKQTIIDIFPDYFHMRLVIILLIGILIFVMIIFGGRTMKKELAKRIVYYIKKASLNSIEIKSLIKSYDSLKNVFINQDLIQKIESLETIIDSYDILLAFICGVSDRKNNSDKRVMALNGGIEHAVDLSLNYRFPVYRAVKKQLVGIQSTDNYLIIKAGEYLSYINYELIKLAYIFGVSINPTHKIQKGPHKNSINEINKNTNLCFLSEKIKYCRKSAHITQQQISIDLQVNRTLISKYENNVCKPPITFIMNYSNYFCININDFLNDSVSLQDFIRKYPNT